MIDDQNALTISVITVTMNSAQTLQQTIASVNEQVGVQVEHIVKDGGSGDETCDIVRKSNPHVRLIEKPDDGIYDAMNQGFEVATGDIVCFLGSNDYFQNNAVLKDIVDAFNRYKADIVYGDTHVMYDDGRIMRKWRIGALSNGRLNGYQLAHSSFFVRRTFLARLIPPFDTNYKIAADFKQQTLLIDQMGGSTHYIPKPLTNMRFGGLNTGDFSSILRGWRECMRAYHEVSGRSGIHYLIQKLLRKF